jgi:hypothetical protein
MDVTSNQNVFKTGDQHLAVFRRHWCRDVQACGQQQSDG